ncbi:uncharacterized protein L3040_005110 [Drepanopeziza brunnea f. sp. 'multigermtubi']|uniref:Uncharacterized protein n=1 Tax=Marssonina brunnea f. sp. multigermtubi (strain MB_m1) TaxID=1072389 RepID=K1WMS1_MARBU|nr:uncharacterized protein MBM_08340 [Drepanopeziza brunnea f. sp. 'multigermtubi' MB_m1]EKD13622.1 hypothetical protein MBM_08340 [Drepanopeziza brunnea f. sp. 'multigermtubi' MB_m1]KAJ5041525.1 hypothetical protein L3040_005110 [Drepanopeziza brunnea f. sp. 'multigermtubi']
MARELNCTDAPAEAATDGNVAGAGVLLSFIITAALSLVLSLVIVAHEKHGHSSVKTIRKLLLSLSDQQILTGIGIQSIALAKMTTMVPYHFFIVWMLSLLSTATHVGTLLALVNDFKRDWVLRWLRQVLMFVNLLLSIVSGIFILMSVMKDVPPTLPIACVWEVESTGTPSNAGTSIAGTIAVIVGQLVFFVVGVWYLHVKNRAWLKSIQLGGLLVLSIIGMFAAIRVIMISQAFGNPSVPLRDMGEKIWDFGQLLPLLLLLLPLVSMIEIMRGEMNIPCPLLDGHGEPLLQDGEKLACDRRSFQPNPFWGTEMNQFGK